MSKPEITLSLDDAREIRDELQATSARLDRLLISGGSADPARHNRIKRLAEVLTTRIARHERGQS